MNINDLNREYTILAKKAECYVDSRFPEMVTIKVDIDDESLLQFINHLPFEKVQKIVKTFEACIR
jgi:hypothetical protein